MNHDNLLHGWLIASVEKLNIIIRKEMGTMT